MAAAQIIDKLDNQTQGASTGLPDGKEASQAVGSVSLDKTPDAKTIKLSGPLSLIYSQALIQVYGLEDAGSEAIGAVVHEDVEEPDSYEFTAEPNFEGVDGVFVYAVSQSDLEQQSGVAVACESIFKAAKTFKNVVVAIECYNYKNMKNVQLVMEAGYSVKATIFTKRNNAITHIKNL